MSRPLPSDVLNRELDRAVAAGVLRDFAYYPPAPGINRWWDVKLADGTGRTMGPGEVEAFTLGVTATLERGKR